MIMDRTMKNLIIITCGILYYLSGVINCHKIRPKCSPDDVACEFYLTLSEYQMMALRKDTSDITFTEEPAVFYENGTVGVRNRRNCRWEKFISDEEAVTIPTGDGSHKLAYLFNETLPGPPIVVFENQQVVVHVKNDLTSESTTIHWHGLLQVNTPWMDGVPGVSQCPINPGETFTYRFMARNPGTYWYHSHYATQRTMGAYGPLIVLHKLRKKELEKRLDDPIPVYEDEYYMIVSDWYSKSSLKIVKLVETETVGYFNGWDISTEACFNSTKQADGVDCGVVPFQGGIINGKGRKYNKITNKPINPEIPLETFTVKTGKIYRFRMICASMTFAFKVRIDGHKLNVIASDGRDFRTKQVDSIIISSGERYDFWIEANDSLKLGNYWIVAETLEKYQNNKSITPNYMEAVLHYEDAPKREPTSKARICTAQNPCLVLDCPYNNQKMRNITCIKLTDLERITPISNYYGSFNEKFQEYMLNFHFTGYKDNWEIGVNGIQNIPQSAPPQIYPSANRQHSTSCNGKNCVGELCKCTHMIEVPLEHTVQIVFFITISNPVGVLNGNSHNVHIHGHSVHILKIAYPTYDNLTGLYKERNKDIKCYGIFCNKAEWSNSTWKNGNIPGLAKNPIQKDSIVVPVGGYVVTRFKANSAGYWYIHCHTEFHNHDGMALVLKVGNDSQMNAAPKHMNKCGNFDITNEEFLDLLNNPRPPETEEEEAATTNILLIMCVFFAATTLILLFSNIFMFLKSSKKNGYIDLSSDAWK